MAEHADLTIMLADEINHHFEDFFEVEIFDT